MSHEKETKKKINTEDYCQTLSCNRRDICQR